MAAFLTVLVPDRANRMQLFSLLLNEGWDIVGPDTAEHRGRDKGCWVCSKYREPLGRGSVTITT